MDPEEGLQQLARRASENPALSAAQKSRLLSVAEEPYEPGLNEYMVFEAIRSRTGRGRTPRVTGTRGCVTCSARPPSSAR